MKKIIQIIMPVLMAFMVLAVPLSVHAATPAEEACQGIEAAGGSCSTGSGANDSFKKLITSIVNILSLIVGAVSVVMIIIGGFRYVISGGDSNGVQGAKNTIMYAIIGLVIVLFAQVIVAFVYSNAKPATSTSTTPTTPAPTTPTPTTPTPTTPAPTTPRGGGRDGN